MRETAKGRPWWGICGKWSVCSALPSHDVGLGLIRNDHFSDIIVFILINVGHSQRSHPPGQVLRVVVVVTSLCNKLSVTPSGVLLWPICQLSLLVTDKKYSKHIFY